jgi:hypothetical protein
MSERDPFTPISEGECGPYKVRLFEHAVHFVRKTDLRAEEPWEVRMVHEYGTSFGDFVREAMSDEMLRYGYQQADDMDILCIYDHGNASEQAIRTGDGRAGENFGYVVNVQVPDFDEWSYQSQWPLLGQTREEQVQAFKETMQALGMNFIIDVGPQVVVSDSGERRDK